MSNVSKLLLIGREVFVYIHTYSYLFVYSTSCDATNLKMMKKQSREICGEKDKRALVVPRWNVAKIILSFIVVVVINILLNAFTFALLLTIVSLCGTTNGVRERKSHSLKSKVVFLRESQADETNFVKHGIVHYFPSENLVSCSQTRLIYKRFIQFVSLFDSKHWT